MAEPIRNIDLPSNGPEQARAQTVQSMENTMLTNAEALTEYMRFIQLLHGSGILEMCNAMLEQGQSILEIVVSQAKKPEYAGGLKNMLGLVQMVGEMDVGVLRNMVGALSDAGEAVEHRKTSTGGMWKMLGAMRDPNVAAGMGFLIEVMRALGKRAQASASHPEP